MCSQIDSLHDFISLYVLGALQWKATMPGVSNKPFINGFPLGCQNRVLRSEEAHGKSTLTKTHVVKNIYKCKKKNILRFGRASYVAYVIVIMFTTHEKWPFKVDFKNSNKNK